MTKDEFINRIVCEHWFDLISWKGKGWDERKKSIWLSGMHRAWNLIFPAEKIEPLEVVRKASTWTKEEAEQWYVAYLRAKEADNGRIEDRFDILDL